MLGTERCTFILERLAQSRSVRVSELAATLQVDPVTIRRDLERLETEGYLHRVHGGAVLRENNGAEPQAHNLARRIAETAARMLPDHSVLFLGPGPLTLEIVPFLSSKTHLTIITNAIDVAWAIAASHPHTLHVIGGQAEEDHGLYNPTQAVPQIRADWVILEAKGLDAERGLTDDRASYAHTARALFGLGAQVMELMLPEQIGHTGVVFIAPAEEVDVLITGREAANAPLWDLSEVGIRVVLT